jgi:hypothetical protein
MTWPFDTAFATQGKRRGFHHLADRLALTDDSLKQLLDYLSSRGSLLDGIIRDMVNMSIWLNKENRFSATLFVVTTEIRIPVFSLI